MNTVELFTMPGCDACGPVRRLLNRVAAGLPDVVVHEVDLAEHPEVAAQHRLLACPAVAINGTVRFVGGVSGAGEQALRELLAALQPEGALQ